MNRMRLPNHRDTSGCSPSSSSLSELLDSLAMAIDAPRSPGWIMEIRKRFALLSSAIGDGLPIDKCDVDPCP